MRKGGWLAFLCVAIACGSSAVFRITLLFPDQESMDRAERVQLYALIPGQGASCDPLLRGLARPGDGGYEIEAREAIELLGGTSREIAELEKVGPGARIFLAEIEDAGGAVFLVGCTREQAGSEGEQEVVLELGPLLEGEDTDGDGHFTPYDCDDENPDVHPGAEETCGDGMDNDCDSAVDDGCSCEPGETRSCWPHWAPTPAGGPCHPGTQTCSGGRWAGCERVVLPQAERCPEQAFDCYVCQDGIDNDCDGFADDRDPGANPASREDPDNEHDRGCGGCFPGEFQPCYSGPEGTAGIGPCKRGLAECVGGAFGVCMGEVLPAVNPDTGAPSEYDLCDGLDNDCDGATDDVEAFPACERPEGRLCGVCTGLVKKCENGVWRNCVEGDYLDNAVQMICGGADEPACCAASDLDCYVRDEDDPGLCDSWDNDCDCVFDEMDGCICEPGASKVCPEGLADPDQGECRAGFFNCVQGEWIKDGTCIEPAAESCDALDNDCDGLTDGQAARDGCPESQAHASWRTCVRGRCVFDCAAGFVDANGDLGAFGSDGCEYECTPTEPAVERCDGLDNECDGRVDAEQLEGLSGQARESAIRALCPPRQHASVIEGQECSAARVCGYACEANWGDCVEPDLDDLVPLPGETDTSDGCETGLFGNRVHCGSCGNACDENEQCSGTACKCGGTGMDCSGSYDDFCCDAECVDLGSSTGHCGACGNACTNQHGSTDCRDSVCHPTCDAGYGDCDESRQNGCETFLGDPSSCGASCDSQVDCFEQAEHASGQSCSDGVCDYEDCDAGYADCDGDRSNGCEQGLWSDDSCGSGCTGRVDCSSTVQNADGVYCNAGTCDYSSCEASYGDCDSNAGNGCETYLWSADSCGSSCAGRVDCNDVIEHARNPTCTSGVCDYGSCEASYGDCDSNTGNGCETHMWSVSSCGTDCDHLFDCRESVRNANDPECNAGVCRYSTCYPGWADCNYMTFEGCETFVWSTHMCGSNCIDLVNCNLTVLNADGISCESGTCDYDSCAAGWRDANGDRTDGCEARAKRR